MHSRTYMCVYPEYTSSFHVHVEDFVIQFAAIPSFSLSVRKTKLTARSTEERAALMEEKMAILTEMNAILARSMRPLGPDDKSEFRCFPATSFRAVEECAEGG